MHYYIVLVYLCASKKLILNSRLELHAKSHADRWPILKSYHKLIKRLDKNHYYFAVCPLINLGYFAETHKYYGRVLWIK